MDIISSKRSWLLAPMVFLIGMLALTAVWAVMKPQELIMAFDNDGCSPVELMTLPLFALIVPLVWLCPPVAGTARRQAFWSSIWSLLGVVAIIRETDLHKSLFAKIWPEVANTFPGTVYKMNFLKAGGVPLMPKLFVLCFFILFFAAVLLPLIRYLPALIRGFFSLKPVAWSAATFGVVSVMVMVVDRLPANLREWGVKGLDDSSAWLSLMKAFEEGGEMLMALLALLALLQSHLVFVRNRGVAQ